MSFRIGDKVKFVNPAACDRSGRSGLDSVFTVVGVHSFSEQYDIRNERGDGGWFMGVELKRV